MKKKLSFMMVALVAIAAFATTMSLTMAKRTATNVFTLTLNGSEVSSPEGFFTHDTSGKFNFNSKFAEAEYDDITFTSGLKMEGTTKVMFTTTEASTVTIVQSDWQSSDVPHGTPKDIKFDGTALSVEDAAAGTGCKIYTIENVAAGDHSITRGSGESGLFYVKVGYAAAPEPAVDKSYTLTFKDSGSDSDASTDLSSEGSIEVSKILGEEEAAYVSSVSDATKVYLARTGRGLKLGTSSVAGTFTLNLATAVKPTSIVVKARKYNDSQNTIKINGNDFTLSADAGDDCTINYDGNTEVSSIAIEAGNKRAYVISVTVNYKEGGGDTPEPADPGAIVIAPASGDIYAALAEATEGKEVKSITINLTSGVTYTASAALVTPADFTINGNGATIDASSNEGDFLTLNGTTEYAKKADGTDSDHKLIAAVEISGVKIAGLKGALVTDAQKTLVEKLTISDAVIEMPAAGKNVLNFNGKGYVGEAIVKNSTIWANGNNTGFFAQYGSRPKNVNAEWLQQFDVQNSTFVNIAYGKNICDLKQNGTAQNVYTLKNNIFVNCGKNGQTVVGFNKGQNSATPVWDVDGNIFNYGGVDKSAAEVEKAGKKDDVDIVKNSVAGVVTFPAAADGNFDGAFVAPDPAAVPAVMPGDPRWTITVQTTFATIAELKALADKAEFGFTSEALVVAQGTSGNYAYTYIKDETGSTVIFDKDGSKTPAEAVGKKIAKDWVGSVSIYHGLFELVPAAALSLAAGEAQEVEYPVVDFSYITAEHAAEAVTLSGVTYSFVNEEELTITKGEEQIAALNKFGLNPGFAKKDVEYNITGVINVYDEKVEFWPIAFVEKPTVDIVVTPEDGTDISAAIDEASKGHFVRNITINLAAVDGGSAKYTLSKSIEAAGNLIINGNGAVIDASALETPFVLMSATPRVDPVKVGDNDVFVVDNVTFQNVTVTGLKYQLFYANKVRYLVRSLLVDNSVIAIDGTAKKTIFDFNGRGNAEELIVKNSTLWAEPSNAQNGGLYSSQSGDGAMDLGGTKQVLSIQNSTLYNIASGKTTCSQRRNDVTGMEFILKNNVIVNCGKVGEFVAGLDGGSYKSKPTWEIENNAFNVVNYNEDGTFTSEDVSAKEDNKMGHEVVKNSYVGSVYFKDVTNGDFAIDAASAAALGNAGDTRWGTYEVAHYNIAVSEDALQYADIAVQATAIEDEIVKVTVTEKNGFKLKELIAKVGAQTTLKVTDNSFIMPPANVGIDAAFDVIAADYELAPAAGTDIAAVLEGKIIRNLKLTLAEGGAYTLTKPIEFSGNLELTGNGATVDASALEAAFVNLAAEPAIDPIVEKKTDEATGETTETILSYPIDNITINGVTIKGLAYQLVKSNNLYLVKELVLDNSVVERKAAQKKTIFDFSGGTGGNVINLTVNKSTLYSDADTQFQNGDFFSSQSSKNLDQLGVDITAEGFTATTAITHSTLYRIANGKTVSTLRSNSKSYMRYVVKNSIITESGKKGQFLKGLNAGGAGTDVNWDVDTNLINFDGDEIAEQRVGESDENIKNPVHAVVTFADAAAGDFNMSIFKDPRIAEWPAIGDPRWAVTATETGFAINIDEAIENGTVTPSKTYSKADETIKLTVTPAEGYELETLVATIGTTEIILAEDNSFTMPAADVTISATFAAVPKLYIIGGPKEWKLDDMTELTYNLETQTYEFEYKPETTVYFAIADKQFTAEEAAAEGAWDVFNANNRYALGEGDQQIDLEVTKPLVKVNGTLVLYAGTYKISITKDMQMTVIGERAPEPTVEKLFIMGTATAKGWDGTTEMTFNEATQAFEYELENTDKIYITFGDAEFTNWDEFNANNRLAIAGGDNNAPVGEEFQLIKVNGTLVLEAGAYKISVTKDLKCIITATTPTGINAIAVDKLDNAVIYNLQGQRVEKSQAKGGVFIVNGKKVAIK